MSSSAIPNSRATSAATGGGGSGRQGQHPPDVQVLGQAGDLEVVGAEVVAPLADAMRLVDGQQRDALSPKRVQKALVAQAFGGDIQQLEPAAVEFVVDLEGLLALQAGVQPGSRHAPRDQEIHLVLHEGDQRRDDHRQPVEQERRQLEAQTLAGAGGEDGQDASAG